MKTKTAQEIQDNIFRKMSADRKIKVGAQLWQLAKDLIGEEDKFSSSPFAAARVGDKIYYGRKRPKTSLGRDY